MGIIFRSRYQRWCVLIAFAVVVLLLDTVFQYNTVTSIFRHSNRQPHGERGKHPHVQMKQQMEIKIHPRRLQEAEDMFFETKLKNQIDFLHDQLNLSVFYTPEPKFQTDFTLKELFSLDRLEMSRDQGVNAVDRPRHILFNSYIRGGSAILVDMVAKQQETFTFPEPLWTITPFGYFTADNFICFSKTGYCRALRRQGVDSSESADKEMYTLFKYRKRHIGQTAAEHFDKTLIIMVPGLLTSTKRKEYPLDTALRILQNIFTCKFDDNFDTLPVEKLPYTDIGHGLRRYIECKRSEANGNCLTVLSDRCQEHKTRVAKVLRLTLSSVENFLKLNNGVKVVHMFRDPRAIISSRLYNADWYHLHKSKRDPSISENARALCQKMILDYRSGTRLMQLFPDRFIFTRYEDLTSSSKGNSRVGNLLNFLNIKPDMTKIKSYGNRFDWRNLMSFKDAGLVEKECREIYDKLGYVSMNSEREMRNMKVDSFLSV